MGKFEEKLRLAKVILTELEKKPIQRVELLKHVIQACGSPARFDSTFNWLKETGRISKAGRSHKDPYKITWKGTQFLAGLSAEEKEE